MQLEIRTRIAFFLVLLEVVSLIALTYVPRDDNYYLVCGCFNLFAVVALPMWCRNMIVIDFQLLNFVALLIQALGFLIYWQKFPVELYNYSIHLTSILQILRLIIVKRGDADGLWQDNYGYTLANHPYFNWLKILFKKEAS